ncbi:hypothetical protein HanIR_Chr06g0263741 [Helianthus annuus]|nr:hypothetical protein HanIR_Chr06g0263741 [Helianthus annuus]
MVRGKPTNQLTVLIINLLTPTGLPLKDLIVFHKNKTDFGIKISMRVFVLILCSHVTLSIHAPVTQLGSTMKPTMFNDLVVIYTVPIASMN